MKKTIIAVIILIIAAVTSISVFLVVKNKRDKEVAETKKATADLSLFKFDSNSINKMIFICDDGEYVAEFISDEWQLTNKEDFLLNTDYIQNVCTNMSSLTATKSYGKADEEKKSMYGLDNPTTITVADENNQYSIYIGNPSPTGDTYYVMVEGKDNIYAIESSYGSAFKTNKFALKNRSLLPLSVDEISEIEIVKNGSTIYNLKYNSNDAVWELPSEYKNLLVDNTSISKMLNVITRLNVESFLDENLEDYSKYGFDKPAAEAIFTGTDGKERKLLFSYYGNDSETYTHVLFEESGQVATFYTADVDFIEYTPASFIAKSICRINGYDVSSLHFEYNNTTADFNIDRENNIINYNEKSLSDIGENAVKAFDLFFDALSLVDFSEIDVTVKPELTNPDLTASYTLNDGTEILFQLVSDDNDKLYAFIDGTYTGAIISMDKLIGKESISSYYDSFIETVEN